MALAWRRTIRKRLTLRILELVARAAPSLLGSRDSKRPGRVERILVVEFGGIGDIVLLVPFLTQLRALFPGAQTTLLARGEASGILAGMQLVDEFIDPAIGWTYKERNYNPLSYDWRSMARLRGKLRRRDFDLAFQSRMHLREHLIVALSGARMRVGYALSPGDGLLTHAVPVGDPDRHKVSDWLGLLDAFGGPRKMDYPPLRISEAEKKAAEQFVGDRRFSPRDLLVGIHPGASTPQKRWDIANFRRVAESLAKRSGVKLLVFVDPEGCGRELETSDGVITAQVGIRELIALISRCDVMICNDSGPMHIAGALGVPVIALFGPRVDRWFAPLGEHHVLLPKESATAIQVIAAAEKVLERPKRS